VDVEILWDLDHDVQGNVQHISEHGITKGDVVRVFDYPVGHGISDSSGLPMIFGYTDDGRYITVVYEPIDKERVYPVTAFEVPEQSD